MAITTSQGYHLYDGVIRTGTEKHAGIRQIFIGNNEVGHSDWHTSQIYDNSAIAGYIQDANGTTKEITEIYRGNTCLWKRGLPSTIKEYVKVYYIFYRNGVGMSSTADSVESYKSMDMNPSSEPTAIGVYIEPMLDIQIEVNIYKNGIKVEKYIYVSTNTVYYDDDNIVIGYPYLQESFFGNRNDPYVYKFKSDYTQGTSSGALSNTSSGSLYEYTFEIVRLIGGGPYITQSRTVLATMTVDLAGHDYRGYL